MAQNKGLAAIPGFNRDYFEFGRNLANQPNMGGVDPNALAAGDVWNHPFQNPYQAGPDTPQLGGPPPMGMQPQMGLPPMAENSPIGGPVMSQGQGGGPTFDPQSFADSVMMGLIMGNFTSNPQAAVQMATQWRGARDQRRFQAEQNELNREAQKENIKARALIDKQKTDEANFNKRIAAKEAALRKAGVDPQKIVDAFPMGINPDNIEDADTLATKLIAEEDARKNAEKSLATDIKNKQSIAQTAAKTGATLTSEYTKEGGAKYDPELAKSLPILAQNRRAYETSQGLLRTARLEREKALTKLSNKKLSDGSPDMASRARMQRNLKAFGIVESHITSAVDNFLKAKATAAAYSGLNDADPTVGPLKLEANAAVETYKQQLEAAQAALIDNEAEFAELNGKNSAANDIEFDTIDSDELPPEVTDLLSKYPGSKVTLPKGAVPTPTKTAPSTSQPAPQTPQAPEASPGADMEDYIRFVSLYPDQKARADKAWAKRHGNAPPPQVPPPAGR